MICCCNPNLPIQTDNKCSDILASWKRKNYCFCRSSHFSAGMRSFVRRRQHPENLLLIHENSLSVGVDTCVHLFASLLSSLNLIPSSLTSLYISCSLFLSLSLSLLLHLRRKKNIVQESEVRTLLPLRVQSSACVCYVQRERERKCECECVRVRVPNLYMGNVLHCNFNLFRQFFVEPISSKVSHDGRMTTIGKFITKIAQVRQTELHPEDKFETVNLFIQTHKKN